MLQMIAAGGDRQIRPQAKLMTRRVGEHIGAQADVFAGALQKRLCRLQDGLLDIDIS